MKILLVGGSKSGKSMLAQRLARSLHGTAPMYYYAAMDPVDDEDRERIRKHVKDRDGWGFTTVERARNVSEEKLDPSGTVLFDSVTALLANEMFGDPPAADSARHTLSELMSLSGSVSNFVCVADELFRDGTEHCGLTEEYRRGLAFVLNSLAEGFDAVCEVVCSVPKVYKGELPPIGDKI
ncbi:MAG: bifunctional adenosylcobinamide kinase/adenosylcobinamide-phosphate guanylyltransferase [Clostridia bacterium]|nr:bifunctional adenosylcobinamide kinase/adenosylcobinamide-phosphate guanylyltransferase [Clostridia bacterium]